MPNLRPPRKDHRRVLKRNGRADQPVVRRQHTETVVVRLRNHKIRPVVPDSIRVGYAGPVVAVGISIGRRPASQIRLYIVPI